MLSIVIKCIISVLYDWSLGYHNIHLTYKRIKPPVLDCIMNKPNVPTEGVATRFTEIQQHLKAINELLDSIGAEPYIPSYRHTQLAHLSDKCANMQENVHRLHMNLAHLG